MGLGGKHRTMDQSDKSSSPFTKDAEANVWGWKPYQGTFSLGGITRTRTRLYPKQFTVTQALPSSPTLCSATALFVRGVRLCSRGGKTAALQGGKKLVQFLGTKSWKSEHNLELGSSEVTAYLGTAIGNDMLSVTFLGPYLMAPSK